MSKRKLTILILTQALLFIAFLITTSWFNRFVADDYFFIGELNNKPLLEIFRYYYFSWHGRWTSNFLLLAILELRNIPFFLFFYFLFSYGLMYFSIKRFIKYLFANLTIHISKKELTLYSAIALGVFFFCTVTPNETWFWYNSSMVYFWSVIAFFFATSSYLKLKKNIIDYIIFYISLIYIGGSNEPLTAFVGLLLVLQLLKKSNYFQKTIFNKIQRPFSFNQGNSRLFLTVSALGLTILSIAFFINFMSPGTTFRDKITPSLNFINWLLYIGYGSLKFLFFSLYKTFIPALLFAVPFYYLGKKSNYRPIDFSLKPQLIYSLLGIGFIVLINQTIVITALGSLSPDRATISSSIFISFIIIRFIFLMGIHYQNKNVATHYILITNIIALVIFNGVFFKVHQNFAQKADERIQFILENNQHKKIIEVNTLPFSGFFYNPTLKADTNYFVNQHLKIGLGVDCNIVLKE